MNTKERSSSCERKMLTREKVNLTLRVDKSNLEDFKVIMKDLGLNISGWLDEMMPRVVDAGIHGGEVAFGIIPNGIRKEAFIKSLTGESKKEIEQKEATKKD